MPTKPLFFTTNLVAPPFEAVKMSPVPVWSTTAAAKFEVAEIEAAGVVAFWPLTSSLASGEVVPRPSLALVLSQKKELLFWLSAPLAPAKMILPWVGANQVGAPAPPDMRA